MVVLRLRQLRQLLGWSCCLLLASDLTPSGALPHRRLGEDRRMATMGPRPATLTWDRTGDFGPHTPGTRTHGWQEALDHCAGLVVPGHSRPRYMNKTENDTVRGYNIELQVQGGGGVYHLGETLVFPPFQDFKIDGGVWVLNFEGNMSMDAVIIDSLMNVHLELGTVVYGGTGAALRLRPKRPVGDGFPCITESRISLLNGIADPRPFTPGKRNSGTGLMFDSRWAAIIDSQINIESILNYAVLVDAVDDPGTSPLAKDIANNVIHIDHLHTNGETTTTNAAARAGCFGSATAFIVVCSVFVL